jgi:hypothetical protein
LPTRLREGCVRRRELLFGKGETNNSLGLNGHGGLEILLNRPE